MEHVLLKAATTATDQGVFEAVISTATPDREKDIVEPTAMLDALTKWAAIGKLMPLAYSHRDPKTGHSVVVGHIDPASARIENDEVIAKGFVDQSTERGQETWRLIKSGTLSFSFGYLIPDGGAKKLSGGGLRIHAIDLYEVSVVPVGPANNDTRVLSYKAMSDMAPADLLDGMIQMAQAYIASPPDAEDADEMRSILDDIQELVADVDDAADTSEDASEGKTLRRILREMKAVWTPAYINDLLQRTLDAQKSVEVTDKETKSRSVDPLRAKADAVELEFTSGGESNRKPPAQKKDAPKPRPQVELDDLRRRMRDETLQALSGVEEL